MVVKAGTLILAVGVREGGGCVVLATEACGGCVLLNVGTGGRLLAGTTAGGYKLV